MGDQNKYRHVVKAIFDAPWAVMPDTLERMAEVVRLRIAGAGLSDEEIRTRIAAATSGPRTPSSPPSQIALIPVYGVISQRQNLLSATSGGTSVDGLTADLRSALADDAVGAIVLEIDSQGGSVDGIPELADEIRASRGGKPIVASVNTLAASAAYWLAAQCDEISCTKSGRVGSIGIFAKHEDLSKADEMAGVKTTLISAGPYKTEDSEHAPLTDDALAWLQDQVDTFYGMFVGDVANGRGIDASTVEADYGGGRVLLAKAALKAGMIDRVETLDATIARLARGMTASRPRAVAAAATTLISASASGEADFAATAIASHHTDTDEGSWDGPAEEAKVPNTKGEATFKRLYAWQDPAADPDTKAAYKFMHHFWRSGAAGPASTKACSNGIGVLNGGRGGSSIPPEDRKGVHAHLAMHLTDAGMEAPALNSLSNDEFVSALGAGPHGDRLQLVVAEASARRDHLEARRSLRAETGKSLTRSEQRHLDALKAFLHAMEATDEAERPVAAGARLRMQLEVEAASRGYSLAQPQGAPQ